MGKLPNHNFLKHSAQGEEFESLPETGSDNLHYIIECFVNDYISLDIPTSQEQLSHVENAVMKGIHDIFPADADDEEDSISLKNLKKQQAQCNLEKEVLVFHFDAIEKTIWLEAEKRDTLLLTISKWVLGENKGQQQDGIGTINFKEFQSITSKLRQAFIYIPQTNGLFSPVNLILALEPELVFLHRNPKLLIAIKDMKTLLRESTLRPTKCKELISGCCRNISGHT